MKKSMWMAACAVCAVSLVASASLDLTITATPTGTADQYTIDIYGQLNGETTEGLALFGCNLTIDQGSDLGAILDLDAPAGMASFDRNSGLTNPPGPGNSGYGGTPAGATLLQIGGGQNTIGNTAPPVYPVGTVAEGVAMGTTPQLLATGVINLSGYTYPVTLTLDAGFANIIDAGQSTSPYSVTPVGTVNCGNVVIPPPGPIVEIEKVNSMAEHRSPASSTVEEFPVQIYPAMRVGGVLIACEPRQLSSYKLNMDLSDVITDASGITVTATNTSSESFPATVTLDPSGDMLVAEWATLATSRIYTITVAGDDVVDLSFEYVLLIGNLTNSGGAINTVNGIDKGAINAALGYTVDQIGGRFDIQRRSTSNGKIDGVDKSLMNACQGFVAY